MMVLEAQSRFREDVPVSNVTMFGLWPIQGSQSAEYLDRFTESTPDTLSMLMLTTLTRYADFRTNIDATGSIRNNLNAIFNDPTSTINTRVHQLFGVLYENLTGNIFDFEEGGVNFSSPTLDVAESEARVMMGQLFRRTQKYESNDFVELIRIDKSTTPPADTIIIGMLMNFAIDLALIESDDQYKARKLLSPLFLKMDGATAKSKVTELMEFVSSRITQM
jgi:hypothetical protein